MMQAVVVSTQLRLTTDQGTPVLFQGTFVAMTGAGVLGLSLLGRDILDLFAVIVDRPGDVVCLLAQHHQYRIEWVRP